MLEVSFLFRRGAPGRTFAGTLLFEAVLLRIFRDLLLWRGLPVAAALLSAAMSATAAAGAPVPRPELLVAPEWLAGNLAAPGLRVVDLREPGAYGAGHIPGAVNLPLAALLAEQEGIPAMLPPVENVTAALARAGIGAETVVVGYDNANGLSAARLFWTLDYLGQGQGRVLDGGWGGWAGAGLPVSRETPSVAPQRFRPRVDPKKIADRQWMLAHLANPRVAMVDARSAAEFKGLVRYARRGGHIPGAISFDWKTHLDPARPGFMKPAAELLRAYEGHGLSGKQEIAVYCQVMMRAAHAYFVLKWLGYPQVRGYDGSWAEWGNREDTPVEQERRFALPLGLVGAGALR